MFSDFERENGRERVSCHGRVLSERLDNHAPVSVYTSQLPNNAKTREQSSNIF